ncbi:glycosyltransferase family 2 protein [Spongisporangium articulatum]|uniref:Glycosyltransferase family 2 protein n=1 Tax=Spongisporangium articulatum TaxID=3362603 RepID=A0ABW8APZ1_9ACTN
MDGQAPEAKGPERLPADVAVSIVLCVLNEQKHVEQAVQHALDQDHPGDLELVIALGPSKDRTDAIVAELAETDKRVSWVRNPDPAGSTPAGLNAAIAATKAPVVCRIDGHALLPRDYVRTAVETMRATGADNVGGVMAAEGVTPFEQAVARAMTSRFGVGNASFHTGGEAGPADTVYLGVFRRSALDRVGGYDESFLRAQDWEMNLRIRRSGGQVWFQPKLRVSYRPRSTMKALSRQYFHYGRWRRVVMRRHEGTVNLRYLAPPLALTGVVAGTVAALAGFRPAAVLPIGYAATVLLASAVEGRGLPAKARAWLPVTTATMHLTWGAGFLSSPRKLAEPTTPGPGSSHSGPKVVPSR